MRWVLAVALVCSVASADPASDANAALQAFVAAAQAKQLPAGVEAFIAPAGDSEQAVADLDQLAKIVAVPKLKIVATHVAKSGTAAWIVAQISGATYDAGKPLRASAFATLDGGSWHVRAAHISSGKPNPPRDPSCGLINPSYHVPPQIAPGAAPAVKVITDAFSGQGMSAHVISVLSDDPAAQMFGSAPGEVFVGGAAIKKVFKSWNIDLFADPGEHTRAGIAPGGDLAWVAMDVGTAWQCTSYRALFVLQNAGGVWRIVHQHYSESI